MFPIYLYQLLLILAFLTFLTTVPSLAVFFMFLYFILTAYLVFLIDFSFVSLIILIVYAGAIAMLFIFCIMLFERTSSIQTYFLYKRTFVFFCAVVPFSWVLTFALGDSPNSFKNISHQNFFSDFYKLDFLEVFGSFFFMTTHGLIYTTFIGFLLFFFTLCVTHIFYFTKK
jgi:NADH:ubiquinone oxidoreductase subunit 6 (subunit J)